MTKSELVAVLAGKQCHLSYEVVENAMKEVFESMNKALQNGERIEIRGFGSFDLRHRATRNARNPKTGAIVITNSKYIVHFKPGKELKEKVNS